MTAVRIAHVEPWPGKRSSGHGFRISSFLVVLTDDAAGRALPIWLNGPEGHGLFHGRDPESGHPEPAEVATAGLLRVAGVAVTGVDIDELDTALTTGPQRGPGIAQATARIEFTTAGAAEVRQLPVRIGYALALAQATGAPVRVPDQLMDRLAVPAQDDLVDQFTKDVPVPHRRRGVSRLFHRHRPVRVAAH
jgi:bifunctional DNase/RNase